MVQWTERTHRQMTFSMFYWFLVFVLFILPVLFLYLYCCCCCDCHLSFVAVAAQPGPAYSAHKQIYTHFLLTLRFGPLTGCAVSSSLELNLNKSARALPGVRLFVCAFYYYLYREWVLHALCAHSILARSAAQSRAQFKRMWKKRERDEENSHRYLCDKLRFMNYLLWVVYFALAHFSDSMANANWP